MFVRFALMAMGHGLPLNQNAICIFKYTHTYVYINQLGGAVDVTKGSLRSHFKIRSTVTEIVGKIFLL